MALSSPSQRRVEVPSCFWLSQAPALWENVELLVVPEIKYKMKTLIRLFVVDVSDFNKPKLPSHSNAETSKISKSYFFSKNK